MKVNGKDYIPYMKWKNKKCSKPPTKHVSKIVFTTEHIKHIAKPCKTMQNHAKTYGYSYVI
jgi:hypothetical protein